MKEPATKNKNTVGPVDTLKLFGYTAVAALLAGCNLNISNTPDYPPTFIPTGTPTLTPTPMSEPTITPTPTYFIEPTPIKDRAYDWKYFWPDNEQEAANMFGGDPSQWMRNPDWSGNKKAESTFVSFEYFPIEWKLTNPDNPAYVWPKTPSEAASYFFPGQPLDPKWLRQNQYGGWELMQDHWIEGYATDMQAIIPPAVVAEGYTVHGDDIAENDRNFVAFGGKNDGVNGGIALPVVNGQGMTFWMPGTDVQKIGIEAKPYNIPYYKGKNGEQLGPNAINFTPIYPAPGFE